VANQYMLRLSDGWGAGAGWQLDFSNGATGSFIDGKRTGLSGYMFREMAGKVWALL
jgi:hypothetical protein